MKETTNAPNNQTTKHLLLSVLFFSLLITSCQRDDDAEVLKTSHDVKIQPVAKFTKVKSNFLFKSKLLNKELKRIGNSTSEKSVYSSTYGFSINTEEAILNTNAQFKTYTFEVLREGVIENEILENLVMDLDTISGEINNFLFTYPRMDNTFDFNNVSVLKLTNNDFTQGRFDSECVVTNVYTESVANIPCSENVHYGYSSNCIAEVNGFTITYGTWLEVENCTGNTWTSSNTQTPQSNPQTSQGGGIDYNNPNAIFTAPVEKPIWQQLTECLPSLLQIEGASTFLQTDVNFYFVRQLKNYACNGGDSSFATEALKAKMANGYVDFEEKRINNIRIDGSVPECLQNIIFDLALGNVFQSTNSPITLIKDIFDLIGNPTPQGSLPIEVTYKMSDLIDKNGETTPAFDNTTNTLGITIIIDSDLVNNGTKLGISKTVLHESLHAYLLYLKQLYHNTFNTTEDLNQLLLDYQVYSNLTDPQHIYMATIIDEFAFNLKNFCIDNYSYPAYTNISYYEAVSWSGLTKIGPTNNQIDNPVFVQNYPNLADRLNILRIANTESGFEIIPGYQKLIDNNCNN